MTISLLPARVPGGARSEAMVAAVISLLVGLSGSAAGLVWAAVAPAVAVPQLVANAADAYRYQIGGDAWFLLVAAVAGLLSAAVVVAAFGQRGPGAVIGLAVGGSLAAVVADRVGYLAARSTTSAALQAVGAHPDGSVLSQIDERVRALGVLTAWPIVAVLVVGLVVAVDASRR